MFSWQRSDTAQAGIPGKWWRVKVRTETHVDCEQMPGVLLHVSLPAYLSFSPQSAAKKKEQIQFKTMPIVIY